MRPGKPGFRIKHIWAFIAVDPKDGSEGVPAALGPNGQWMPLIAADEDRLASVREIARELAKLSNVKIRLVRFDTMVELGDLES